MNDGSNCVFAPAVPCGRMFAAQVQSLCEGEGREVRSGVGRNTALLP